MPSSESSPQMKDRTQVDSTPIFGDNDEDQNTIRVLSQHGDMPRDLNNRHQSMVESEILALLEAIKTELASQSTPLQFAWNASFQTVCVIIAFLFGVFSIFSWRGQKVGNSDSVHATQLAIISLCLTSNSVLGTSPLKSSPLTPVSERNS
jgi:hypothetical protein